MMPAWLLWPWEVHEMHLQDMKQVSSAGNRCMLILVDRASTLVFAYPLESKDSVGVARKLRSCCLRSVCRCRLGAMLGESSPPR